MGLLEDIGRSPAGSRPSSLVTESVGLMQNIERQNIVKADEERKATVFNKQKEQWAKEEKMLESQGDITLLPGYKMLSPKGQQDALKHFSENGYTDEKGRGKYRNIMEGFKVMFDSEEAGTYFMKDAAENTYSQIMQVDQDIAKAANNPKKAQELATTKNALMQRYFFLLGKTDEYVKMKAAEAKAKGTTGIGGKSPFEATQSLRKEFTAQSKVFRDVRDSFARVEESSIEPSAAGDLALIFNYMKMLDPASVVRESEFAQAAATGAWGERIKAAGLKILEGERLSPVMRTDFVNRAGKLMERQSIQHKQREVFFRKQAERFGLSPEDVAMPLTDPGREIGEEPIPEGQTATNPNTGEKLIYKK